MLETHPHRSSHPEDVARCADAAFACVEACKVCADACLSEERVSLLTSCIRLNLDCAEVCAATGSVVLRIGRTDPQPLQAQLAACIEACRDCPDECRRHAATHAHCRLCAEACDACRAACETMMATMRHAGESEADTR
ncbi:MAG: four-helix bundle copper-binding protein [Rhizobiales bacterium]|nr:four-helix bundle copper-binding protein [Hyphomicrobiales bacterium]